VNVNKPSSSKSTHSSEPKPIEIYMFIDPICPECWALEPILKKLVVEYGKYFSIRHVISGKLTSLNITKKKKYESIAEFWDKTANKTGMSCDGSLWLENPVSSPFIASIAIKAAELQGRRAGIRFLRKLQEFLFLDKQNICQFEVLKNVAASSGLDVEEFITDINSDITTKAFQYDLKITTEMEVDEIPTLVFFNENAEDEGIKVTGFYPYEVYVQIIEEIFQAPLVKSSPPPLEEFLRYFSLVGTKEIAVVYNMTTSQVDREMKKLLLKQKVEPVPVKHGMFWRYIDQ
jgi:predicted DsbA family dithiol-disulfide isomerase